jgi:hypothetical protein
MLKRIPSIANPDMQHFHPQFPPDPCPHRHTQPNICICCTCHRLCGTEGCDAHLLEGLGERGITKLWHNLSCLLLPLVQG